MARPRTTNKHLPPHVHLKNGCYRYQVPAVHRARLEKSWITLAKKETEMWKAYAELMNKLDSGTGMVLLFERYECEVIPTKAPRTQQDNRKELKKLRAVFGQMEPGAITIAMAYQYQEIRGKQSATQANHEIALLRHVFTWAARWGVVPANPLQNMQKIHVPVRDRVPTEQEASAVKKHADEFTKLWIDFKWQTGLRQGDMLKIKISDFDSDGINIKANKNAKKGIADWTPKLRETVERIKSLNKVQGMTLFCDNRGRPMKGHTVHARFKRAVDAALRAGDLQNPFTENDIRSYFGTRSEERGLDATKQLLHRSSNAKKHYVHNQVVHITPLDPPH